MRTLKLTLAYDGTAYAGWQMQAGGRPTIQGVVQEVLRRILQEPVHLIGSGRTDAGVHALAQVAHVRTDAILPVTRLQHALNSLLPSDIVVTGLEEAPRTFHARFAAKTKRYRYRLVTGPVVLPFERCYVHHVRRHLNVAVMRREAMALRGRHDVRAFHRSGRPVADTRRTIVEACVIRRDPSHLDIDIEADGFLYMMVRSIVGTLLDVGRGSRPAGTVARILKTQDRRLVGPTAPAKGLCLVGVTYSKSCRARIKMS